eukprot:g28080.t1
MYANNTLIRVVSVGPVLLVLGIFFFEWYAFNFVFMLRGLGRWRGEPLEAAFAGSKEETNGDRTETRKSWVVNKTNATIAYDTCIA